MRQHKLTDDYISASIPKNLSNSVKKNIRFELESHIEERTDFYISIGYDEKTAEEKAVEEMGDSNEVKEGFNTLYRTSGIPALLFPIAYIAVLIFIIINGLFLFTIDSGDDPSSFGVFVSTSASLMLFWIIYYSYRKNKLSMLFSITATMLSSIFFFLFTSCMYQFFIYGIADLLRLPENVASNVTFCGSFIMCIVYLIVSMVMLTKCGDEKIYTKPMKIRFYMNEKKLAVIFLVITIVLTGNFGIRHGFVSTYSDIGDLWFSSINDKKCTRLYDEINFNMSYNEVKILLENNGFVDLNKYKKAQYDQYDNKYEYTENGEEIVVFIPEKCIRLEYMIIVPNSGDKAISFKRLDYGVYADCRIKTLKSVKEQYYKNLIENFDKLKVGMSIEESKQALDVTDKALVSAWSGKCDDEFVETLCYNMSSEEYFYPSVEVNIFFENDKLVSAQRESKGDLEEAYDIKLEKLIGDEALLSKITAEQLDSYGAYYINK